MALDDPSRGRGPIALSDLFDKALNHLAATPTQKTISPPSSAPSDGFLYSGNRHESVPRALFLDRRLTPLERNAWQVFRLLLNDDGLTAFPTYDQLRPWLGSMPGSAQASHETVARALTLLRLSRWLSLVRRRRDPKSGRILGNLYVLHDEPLTPFEAMQLDPDYLGLVSQALGHAAKAVQVVGIQTLKEIAEDPLLTGRTLPTRLQVMTTRLTQAGLHPDSYPQADTFNESEEGEPALLRNLDLHSSESEAGLEPTPDGALRNPNEGRTVRKESNKKIRTTTGPQVLNGLQLPKRFTLLKEEQQTGAAVALQQVDPSVRQAVLDEWEARCRASSIRNPAGYLFGIIQRAIRGEFNAWAGQNQPKATQPVTALTESPKVAAPEVAQEHIARLREMLRSS
ncbi:MULTISPECIES: STY4528 family pathogenicity island replication protein [Xanthomonas]|uniref:STY4528 family pathogenicity island replication protein n=1 Tax=Xanthomonas TaxID=338 RepID=UPI000FD63AD2|nr:MULTISPECIES: STY4528 family pathogenicity island replication protein [Xanthomonas]